MSKTISAPLMNTQLSPSPSFHRINTFAEWQAALRNVQRLYAGGSHIACATECEQLLQTPQIRRLHRAFLHFYAGICYEILAEPYDDGDLERTANLSVANRHFGIAALVLPTPIDSAISTHAPRPSWESHFGGSYAPDLSQGREFAMPSNLKPVQEEEDAYSESMPSDPSRSSQLAAHISSSEPYSPPTDTAVERFREQIRSLHELVEYHLRWVKDRLGEIEAAKAQEEGTIEQSSWSLSDGNRETVQMRIASGRARGWARRRFDANQTQANIRHAVNEASN